MRFKSSRLSPRQWILSPTVVSPCSTRLRFLQSASTLTGQCGCSTLSRSSTVKATAPLLFELLPNRRALPGRDAVLHGLLHLLERTHVDLADALARDAEFGGQIRKRDRVLGEPTRFEDAPLAIVEHGKRRGERLAAIVEFVARGERSLLAAPLFTQPVLPLARIAVLADRRVERGVAAKPPVHVDHVLFRDAEPLGDGLDLVVSHIALVDDRYLALSLAQVEEQLPLVVGGAHLHQRPRAQDVFLDRCPDPPHGVGSEPEALFGLEALDRLHQADIAL